MLPGKSPDHASLSGLIINDSGLNVSPDGRPQFAQRKECGTVEFFKTTQACTVRVIVPSTTHSESFQFLQRLARHLGIECLGYDGSVLTAVPRVSVMKPPMSKLRLFPLNVYPSTLRLVDATRVNLLPACPGAAELTLTSVSVLPSRT